MIKQIKLHSCPMHPNYQLTYFNTNSESLNNICTKCQVDLHYSPSQIIPIQDILSIDPSNIISNWPIFDEDKQSEMQNKLINLFSFNAFDEVKNQIDNFFQSLSDSIARIIAESKQKMHLSYLSLQVQQICVMKEYEDVSQMKQFRRVWKQLFKKRTNGFKNMKAFLTNMKKKSNENYISIEKVYTDFNEELNNLIRNQPNQIADEIYSTTKTILQLSTHKFSNLFRDFQVNYTKIDSVYQSRTKVDKLIYLIDNKFNFCNKESVHNLNQLLQQYNCIFNGFDFNSLHKDGDQPIKCELSKEEIKEVKYLIEQSDSSPQQNILQNEQLSLFNQIFKGNNKHMSQIFKRIFTFSNYKKDFSIQDIYFIKCSFGSSQFLRFRKETYSISILKLKSDDILQCRAYSNFIFDPNLKYILRYQIPKSIVSLTKVGLIIDSYKDQIPLDFAIYYDLTDINFQVQQSELESQQQSYQFNRDNNKSGKCYQEEEEYLQFELKAHLGKGYLAMADYPNNQRVKLFKISEMLQYRLFFYLQAGSFKQPFTLFYSRTVQDFDDSLDSFSDSGSDYFYDF